MNRRGPKKKINPVLYNKCLKCLKPKKNNTVQLCMKCKMNKGIKLADGLNNILDINKIRDEAIAFKYKCEKIQHNYIYLNDINTIITLHEKMYDIDYLDNESTTGDQLHIMWKNIKKFIIIYDV